MREIGDGDHDGGRGGTFLLPPLAGFVPIVAKNGVCGVDEVGERDVRLYFPVDVVFHARVRVDVVKAGFEILPKPCVIADNNTGSLDEAGFDGVVEAEVADDPLEQSFLAASLARGSEGGGGEIETGENPASTVDTVEAPNPLGGFFQFLFCDSFECGFRIAAPSMVSFVVDNDDVLGGSHVFKDLADVCFVAKRAALVHGLLFGDALF